MASKTLEEFLDDPDWQSAFHEVLEQHPRPVLGYTGSVARFHFDDIVEIIAIDHGEHQPWAWIGAFRLKDGRFALVRVGCDFTGWDCRANGDAEVAGTLVDLVLLAMNTEERVRLGYEQSAPGGSPSNINVNRRMGGPMFDDNEAAVEVMKFCTKRRFAGMPAVLGTMVICRTAARLVAGHIAEINDRDEPMVAVQGLLYPMDTDLFVELRSVNDVDAMTNWQWGFANGVPIPNPSDDDVTPPVPQAEPDRST